MIDISDGLSTDLGHICQESGVGAEIEATAVPLASIGKAKRKVDLKFALHGGDDYELLFTAPRNKRIPTRIAGIEITRIGKVTSGGQMFLISELGRRSRLRPQGWQHFRR